MLVAAGLASHVQAQDSSVPASGASKETERPFIASLGGVDIDAYQGNVSIVHNDVLLKGNGGLDITVNRAYSSQGVGGDSKVFPGLEVFTKSYKWMPLGVGWSMHVAPRVVLSIPLQGGAYTDDADVVCKKIAATQFDAIYTLVHSDGRQERLLNSGIGVVSTASSNWRLTCPGVGQAHRLQGPDGTLYVMGERHVGAVNSNFHPDDTTGISPSDLVVQATRITDTNGNWLNISYLTFNGPDRPNFHEDRIVHLPSEITASDGRRLTFTYDPGNSTFDSQYRYAGLAPRLLRIDGPGGAVWQYSHRRTDLGGVYSDVRGVYNYLTEVLRPDGTSWKFDYMDAAQDGLGYWVAGSMRLRGMTLPTGGDIDFAYQYSIPYMKCQRSWEGDPVAGIVSTQIKTVTTSDGGAWDYAFVPGKFTGELDTTTVNGPDGREVYKYIGIGHFVTPQEANANPWVFSCGETRRLGLWQLGLLVEKQRGTDFTETYQFVGRTLSSTTWDAIEGRTFIYDIPAKAAQLSYKVTTINGASYTTRLSGFDPFGNVSTVTRTGPNGESRTSNLTYYVDTAKWIVSQLKNESAAGMSTAREFDTNGNLLSQTIDGVATTYTYDSQGNIATVTRPRGLVHTFSNYKRGIAQTEAQPEGITITRVVSDAGNITSETNGENRTSNFSYDSANRVTGMVYPTGLPATVSYGANSETVTRGDLVEETQFDAFGRQSVTTLGGIRRSFGYDTFGRRTFESNPDSTAGTTYAFDILGRKRRITNADGTFSRIDYQAGNKLVYDERSNLTTYNYRAYGEPSEEFVMKISTPDPAATIIIDRNTKDLVKSVTQNGHTRTYGYNANYYLTSVVNPETGTTVYGRDAAGNMTSRSVGSSGTTMFVYDGHNRLTNATYPDGTPAVKKTYSKTHKIKSVTTSASVRSYDYDTNDNLTTETLTVDGQVLATGYGYNGKDQLQSHTYPRSGAVISYSPDALGRPTQVSGFVSNVLYWPSGLIKQITYNNGVVTSYGQHARLWPNSFSSFKGATAQMQTSYGFDGIGNLTSIADAMDASYNRNMTYDPINRLATISGPWGGGTIAYDGGGNIKSQELGAHRLYQFYDTSNRLSSVSGARVSSYSYDAYGNLIAGSGNTYIYDAAGNMRCFNCNNASLKAAYVYDGLNQRVSVTKAGVISYEMYGAGGNQMIEFTPSQGGKLIEYYYLGGKRVAQRVSP